MAGGGAPTVLARPSCSAASRPALRRRPAAALLGLAGVLGLAGFGAAPGAFVGGAGSAERSETSNIARSARSPFPSEPMPSTYVRRRPGSCFFRGRQVDIRLNPKTHKEVSYPMFVKPGDMVQVMSGKDRGKVTQVIQTWPKWNKILCLGVNFCTKHVRPLREEEPGERVQVEAPMHSSRVMHYDVEEGKAGPLGIRIEKIDNGAIVKVRYNKATGNKIPVCQDVPEWIPVADRS